MEKKTKIIKDLQQEVSLRPVLGSRTLFGVLLIHDIHVFVCSCNFTTGGGDVGGFNQGWPYGQELIYFSRVRRSAV